MIQWWINRKRAQGWKALREKYEPRSLQGNIRKAPRDGDFKFMPRTPWVILLRRRAGYLNTWEIVGEFATLWAARKQAMSSGSQDR